MNECFALIYLLELVSANMSNPISISVLDSWRMARLCYHVSIIKAQIIIRLRDRAGSENP